MPAESLIPVNSIEQPLDPGTEASPIQNWWNSVVDGWHNFWSEVGRRGESYYDQSQVGNEAIASLTDPEAFTSAIDLVGSQFVGSPGSSSTETEGITNIDEALSGSPSLSDYVKNNPDLSAEDYLKYMAENSDEWAEKWIDYVLENQSIDKANAYTASREDTAYQRLVADLKKAGLNPAMMYGSSASTSASGSAGVVKASEGANSRTIGNYEKLKQLLLAYMALNIKTIIGSTNMVSNGLASIIKML